MAMRKIPYNLLRTQSAAWRARSLLAYQFRYVWSFAARQLAYRVARDGSLRFFRGKL